MNFLALLWAALMPDFFSSCSCDTSRDMRTRVMRTHESWSRFDATPQPIVYHRSVALAHRLALRRASSPLHWQTLLCPSMIEKIPGSYERPEARDGCHARFVGAPARLYNRLTCIAPRLASDLALVLTTKPYRRWRQFRQRSTITSVPSYLNQQLSSWSLAVTPCTTYPRRFTRIKPPR